MEDFLTKAQVAALLHCSRPTLDRWIRSGRLPRPLAAPGQVVFRRSDIEQWLANGLRPVALRPARRAIYAGAAA